MPLIGQKSLRFTQHLICLVGCTVSFLLGAILVSAPSARVDTQTERPAYLIAGWKIRHPDETERIRAALDPLASRAGYVALAAGQPVVLEGSWPYDGIVILQRYRSMRALREFWFSPAHTRAKKVRDDHIDSHFVVAIESQQ